ncbi:MAG: type II toxin-antitoxin system RelE/ParE family toxin [Patescibacteria group bacterium]
MGWKIYYYRTSRGDKVVERFILKLDYSTRTKISWILGLLKEYGSKLIMPYTKRVSNRLHELRIRGTVEIRIFYIIVGENIFLLHAFQKKSQKIPLKELELAQKRSDELISH